MSSRTALLWLVGVALLVACGGSVEGPSETAPGEVGSGGTPIPGVCGTFTTKEACCGYSTTEEPPFGCIWMRPEGDFSGACTGGDDDCAAYGNGCPSGQYCYEQYTFGCELGFTEEWHVGACLDL